MVAQEDERLEQLKNGKHVAEEGHVVLLAELVHVEVDAAVQEACDHGQVSAETGGALSALDSRPHLEMLFIPVRFHLRRRTGCDTASFRQARLASKMRLSADLESEVSASSVTRRCTSTSSCQSYSTNDNSL